MNGSDKQITLSNVSDVAKMFLEMESMSHKKLQKLCYYAYSLVLTLSNGEFKLFNDGIEAWVHGPVMPKLYQEYSRYGMYGKINLKRSSIQRTDENIRNLIKKTYDIYGKYTDDQLEEMTHRDEPWQMARAGLPSYAYCDNTISDEDIINYYSSKFN